MNKKIALLAGVILCIILVPLVAAAPSLAKIAQNGDVLQTQDQQQLQTHDCTATCIGDITQTGDQLQTQDRLRTQDQQQLQTQDCNCTQLQTQTRLQECAGSQQAAFGNGNADQYAYSYQNQFQHRNQAP
jgi:ABC-type oligopeptide transport system substrate-binding subunit